MADITYQGITYTSDRLTFQHDTQTGEHVATLDAYYHGAGFSRDVAMRHLAGFLQEAHPDVWHGAKQLWDGYFKPVEGNVKEPSDERL